MGNSFGPHDDPLAAERSRPLGAVRLTSNRVLQENSLRLKAAAGNLLEKAYRALEQGDDDRSRTYLRKAAALPWDEHEDVHPAAADIHQTLFDELTDELESTTGDRWLAAAAATMERLGEPAATAVAYVLVPIAHDYHLPKREAREAKALIGDRDIVLNDQSFGLTSNSGVEEVTATIEPMLRALLVCHQELNRAD